MAKEIDRSSLKDLKDPRYRRHRMRIAADCLWHLCIDNGWVDVRKTDFRRLGWRAMMQIYQTLWSGKPLPESFTAFLARYGYRPDVDLPEPMFTQQMLMMFGDLTYDIWEFTYLRTDGQSERCLVPALDFDQARRRFICAAFGMRPDEVDDVLKVLAQSSTTIVHLYARRNNHPTPALQA
ncbi:MAG: hypothetical protein HY421_02060 [Candidatus Kerfeldbacteria bacterium]|nr:hypothetical protein [Candidatus Kerfeldbacteria bacterium]